MIPIKYVTGDATEPIGTGCKIIAHVCNDCGVWGAGFVLALSDKWDVPEIEYRRWYDLRNSDLPSELAALPPFRLGEIQFAPFYAGVYVCNMIAQRGLRSPPIPLRYAALERCLGKLRVAAGKIGASVHMPRIGCGLGGGSWDRVRPLIQRELCAWNVPVTVYDFAGV